MAQPLPVAATLLFLLSGSLAIESPSTERGTVEFRVTEADSYELVPCRIHLFDASGKPQQAPELPFWNDHFVCAGSARITLTAGDYRYEIERGPEYARITGSVAVHAGQTATVQPRLMRIAHMSRDGWWSGELHVHRPLEQIELILRAEDLHVAPVITWWNNRNLWERSELPQPPLVRFDGDRYYHKMAGEDEREGGALLYFHLNRPLRIAGAQREYPSPMHFLLEARRNPQVWVDIEKPFWWDAPVWLASGQIDSIGIANNHMCRSRMYESEAWGRPRDPDRLPAPRGNGFWTQEIYYHLLNAGLRVPPSAGSASGVLPNPVGYNRAYVHVDGEFTHDKWWEGLRAGRSFVTNGPLLVVRANDRLPGHVFSSQEPIELELRAELFANDAVPFIEIIRNGEVHRRVPYDEWKTTGSLGGMRFDTSGWFLVRAVADVPHTFRFASTGPFYVEIGEKKRRISRASTQFFLDWVDERLGRIKLDDESQRASVERFHHEARGFWQRQLEQATTE